MCSSVRATDHLSGAALKFHCAGVRFLVSATMASRVCSRYVMPFSRSAWESVCAKTVGAKQTAAQSSRIAFLIGGSPLGSSLVKSLNLKWRLRTGEALWRRDCMPAAVCGSFAPPARYMPGLDDVTIIKVRAIVEGCGGAAMAG